HTNVICYFYTHPTRSQLYTRSLHDALPISSTPEDRPSPPGRVSTLGPWPSAFTGNQKSSVILCGSYVASIIELPPFRLGIRFWRSEEHTSELQSREILVCRLLLEKKKKQHH